MLIVYVLKKSDSLFKLESYQLACLNTSREMYFVAHPFFSKSTDSMPSLARDAAPAKVGFTSGNSLMR